VSLLNVATSLKKEWNGMYHASVEVCNSVWNGNILLVTQRRHIGSRLGAQLSRHKVESVIEEARAFKGVELVETAVLPQRKGTGAGPARSVLQADTKFGGVTDEKRLTAAYAEGR
jgi:hypothetical protein